MNKKIIIGLLVAAVAFFVFYNDNSHSVHGKWKVNFANNSNVNTFYYIDMDNKLISMESGVDDLMLKTPLVEILGSKSDSSNRVILKTNGEDIVVRIIDKNKILLNGLECDRVITE